MGRQSRSASLRVGSVDDLRASGAAVCLARRGRGAQTPLERLRPCARRRLGVVQCEGLPQDGNFDVLEVGVPPVRGRGAAGTCRARAHGQGARRGPSPGRWQWRRRGRQRRRHAVPVRPLGRCAAQRRGGDGHLRDRAEVAQQGALRDDARPLQGPRAELQGRRHRRRGRCARRFQRDADVGCRGGGCFRSAGGRGGGGQRGRRGRARRRPGRGVAPHRGSAVAART
mmetsp:Transcript_106280/g.298980  ORF Transcript_106280/g.298980 Transcript_106280/m.298980 type:complete len:227 (-) Transcript_106280:1156-1836(-)